MDNSILSNTLDVCGFYELDASGAVLYSRPKSGGKFSQPDRALVGLNFFEKVFVCQNSEDLRRRFNNFVSSRGTTETFVFECKIAENIVLLRVMFVHVSEKTFDDHKESFYIDIKQN